MQNQAKSSESDLLSTGFESLDPKALQIFEATPQGAASSVWAGVVTSADEIGGRYCENCHVSEVVSDDQTISVFSEGVRCYALDLATAEVLWKKSEALVGEKF